MLLYIYRIVLPDYYTIFREVLTAISGGVVQISGGVVQVQLDNDRLLLLGDSIRRFDLRVRFNLGVTIWRPETLDAFATSK